MMRSWSQRPSGLSRVAQQVDSRGHSHRPVCLLCCPVSPSTPYVLPGAFVLPECIVQTTSWPCPARSHPASGLYHIRPVFDLSRSSLATSCWCHILLHGRTTAPVSSLLPCASSPHPGSFVRFPVSRCSADHHAAVMGSVQHTEKPLGSPVQQRVGDHTAWTAERSCCVSLT